LKRLRRTPSRNLPRTIFDFRGSMSRQRLHIHQLSRLAFAQVTDWNRILNELESARKQMFWSYKPLRSGAFNLLQAADSEQAQEIYRSVAELAKRAGGAKCAHANVAALQVFESRFLRSIHSPKDNFMEFTAPGVDFGGAELVGGPHFSAVYKTSEIKFVYLHPSRWEEDQTEAFCELLTVVLEKKFKAGAHDLWFLDLRSGKRIPWRSKRRVRRKCEQAARLLARLRSVNLENESE
jgi:hypothetical protein